MSIVRGVVLDYGRRPASGARVSAGDVTVHTDADGRFELVVTAAVVVTVSCSDMYRRLTLTPEQSDVEIMLHQLPL